MGSEIRLGWANSTLFPQRHTVPVVTGKKWRRGATLRGRKRHKRRHLYEFSWYFSEVIIGQFLSPKLAQNSYLKGEQELYKLLLDSEVGALIRVTIVLYVYLCNCSIRSVIAGTEILMSF